MTEPRDGSQEGDFYLALVVGESVSVDAPEQAGAGLPVGLQPILGRSPVQRHLHHLARLGVKHCLVALGGQQMGREVRSEFRRQVAETTLGSMTVQLADESGEVKGRSAGPEKILLVEAEAVYDPRLYRAIRESTVPIQLVEKEGEPSGGDDGLSPIGLSRLGGNVVRGELVGRPDALLAIRAAQFGSGLGADNGSRDEFRLVSEMDAYLPDLRRHLRPYWCRVRTAEDRSRAERMILDSAQKGVLDFPARFLHPVPENLCVRWAARTRVTPNQITLLSGLMGFGATYLFATQRFAWALGLALIVNVLDGVDGKLARVKLKASRLGDRLDHVLDVSFEFSWYVGLGWGLSQATGHPLPLRLGIALIAVMVGSRAVSGVYKLLSGRQIHDHRTFDRAFRLVAGRRNIYVLLLVAGLMAGRLEGAFTVTFAWGVTTLLVYSVRVLMALAERGRTAAH